MCDRATLFIYSSFFFRTTYGWRCRSWTVAVQPRPCRSSLTALWRRCVSCVPTSLKCQTLRTTACSWWWKAAASSWHWTPTLRRSRQSSTAARRPLPFTLSSGAWPTATPYHRLSPILHPTSTTSLWPLTPRPTWMTSAQTRQPHPPSPHRAQASVLLWASACRPATSTATQYLCDCSRGPTESLNSVFVPQLRHCRPLSLNKHATMRLQRISMLTVGEKRCPQCRASLYKAWLLLLMTRVSRWTSACWKVLSDKHSWKRKRRKQGRKWENWSFFVSFLGSSLASEQHFAGHSS